MTIETSHLPTHLALVARRLNVCSPDDLASHFLETSYLAEAMLKTLAIVLRAGLAKSASETSYRHAYGLVRADGLGTWEQAIRAITTQPTAGYLPPEFFPLRTWISKKRNKQEDVWFQDASEHARQVLYQLGVDKLEVTKAVTVNDLITYLVQIRNKTKAHGAVGDEFYAVANIPYLETVVAILSSCPFVTWKWMHLSPRESGKTRGVALSGTDSKYLPDTEISSFQVEMGGVYFLPPKSAHVFYCGDLIKSNRECTIFLLPNGGYTASGTSEFIDYSTGKTPKESASAYLSPPIPLPPSETEGLYDFDVQSNAYDNLPTLPIGYVKRENLETELRTRLLDKNHPIITLHGGGGVGKTSLALTVAHSLVTIAAPPFEHVVWFSARDVDLRPTGPSEVRPSIIDLHSLSKRFGQLFSIWGGTEEPESLAKALQLPSEFSSKGILFIFDNFETLADVRGLHKFLDEHTHLPNKVLITSRERAFVADYPIEVRGLEYNEAKQMLIESARMLGIEPLMTAEIIERIYSYTGGHAYVMRVIVGEMEKERRFIQLPQTMMRRQDISDAVFERSFNKLSEAGRNVFLLVGNWKSKVSEVSLIVVLGVREIDAMSGLDECSRLSLIEPIDLPGSQRFYSVPQLARGFVHKKLQGDPDRLVIQQDLETLQKFGAISTNAFGDDMESRLITQFIMECKKEINNGIEAIARADKLLEALANSWSPGWLKLAEFRQISEADKDSIDYALRRAVEEEPFSKDAWLARANFAKEIGNEGLEIASLVSAVDAEPSDVFLIREVAHQLAKYVNEHIGKIPKARRGVYLASVRSHMQLIADSLDPTGLSRLAWLFLLEDNIIKAREYANRGCAIDSTNIHCLKILERLERHIDGTFEN